MKKHLSLFFVAFVLSLSFVQCKSNEEKALALINEQMFKTLYDYDSYQPVETKIDSAFHTPFNDSINLKYAVYCSVFYEKFDEYMKKVDNAQREAEIWSDSYSSYGKQKFYDAFEEATTGLLVAEEILNKIGLYQDTIKMRSNELDREFIGWQVTHKFRCKTKGGYSDLSTNIYIMDNKFTKILDQINVDDENYKEYQKIIKDALQRESKTEENNIEE